MLLEVIKNQQIWIRRRVCTICFFRCQSYFVFVEYLSSPCEFYCYDIIRTQKLALLPVVVKYSLSSMPYSHRICTHRMRNYQRHTPCTQNMADNRFFLVFFHSPDKQWGVEEAEWNLWWRPKMRTTLFDANGRFRVTQKGEASFPNTQKWLHQKFLRRCPNLRDVSS